jgi:uncharacterized protein (DUF1501 family)
VSGGYRALVCLFMNGGNDSHNWVVPVDATGYAQYNAARARTGLAGRRGCNPSPAARKARAAPLRMPAELAAAAQLVRSGRAAVLANVGPLLQPTTRAEYQAGRNLPPKLFSHNDQQSTWQSLFPEGAHRRAGAAAWATC